MNTHFPFQLEALPYPYDALEPALDERTLHFHHDKHLQAYVDNLNKTLEPYPALHQKTLVDLLTTLDCLPCSIRNAVRNNGGGVFNHQLYFSLMQPPHQKIPDVQIVEKIKDTFGSYDQWKSKMKEAAMTQFGSGYAWLVCKNRNLEIIKTANQDTPCLKECKPLLLVDVWEHAYYLPYQNRRAEYLDQWFSLINWIEVEKRFVKK